MRFELQMPDNKCNVIYLFRKDRQFGQMGKCREVDSLVRLDRMILGDIDEGGERHQVPEDIRARVFDTEAPSSQWCTHIW